MTEMPKPPPPVHVESGVCPVPKRGGMPGACGESARLFACGWRCVSHAPGRRA